ncbi:MMPL family transporter, partial [bacterium]|nr:MMPL family transporter [bacterium]
YTEFRYKGATVEKALYEAFTRIGSGLLTGAFTTSAAFLALLTTSYPVFREFGFVVGSGILCCLTASLFFLPASIVLKEKIWGKIRKKSELKPVDMEFKFLGAVAERTTRHPYITISAALILTVFFALFINKVEMNSNYMDMEPEGLESVRLQREIPKRFNISADNMVAVTDNLESTDKLTKLLNERPSIGFVESLTDYLPSHQKQAQRLPEVKLIADAQKTLPPLRKVDKEKLIEQLYRFSDNLTEMSSMAFIGGLDKVFDKTNYFLGLDEEGEQIGKNRVDAVINTIESTQNASAHLNNYQRRFKPVMTERISAMSNTAPITLDTVPEDIKERFISNDGKHYLVIMYSKKDIWDGLLTSPFVNTVIRDVPNASGMPLLMKAMVETAKEQGAVAFLVTFFAFFIILLIDFRSIKAALVAALPLLMTIVWMLGIMGITGFPFSIINVIGLPLILGIGIDDGVHIIHRYKIEGRHNLPYAVSSIGKAIFLTTITTLFGFGSLIPSSFRGYASLGTLVVIGISLCFITSVILLPAVIQVVWGSKSD